MCQDTISIARCSFYESARISKTPGTATPPLANVICDSFFSCIKKLPFSKKNSLLKKTLFLYKKSHVLDHAYKKKIVAFLPISHIY